jgi:YfiH family protein
MLSVITRFIMPTAPPNREPEGRVLTGPLLRAAGFQHGFTTRDGTLEDLGFASPRVFTVTQVHGSNVVVAAGSPDEARGEQADAIVMAEGRAGAVRVADCVPILVGDRVTGRAAAIHAGWRGVVGGVVPAALAAMRVRPADLVAAIGPCIESGCFEVGDDVAAQITDAVPSPGVVVKREVRKAWVDLVVAVRAQLEACGVPVASIDRVGGCTKCDAARFHSYRRDGAASGRLLGVIAARDSGPRAEGDISG